MNELIKNWRIFTCAFLLLNCQSILTAELCCDYCAGA